MIIFSFFTSFSLQAHDQLSIEDAEIIDMIVYKKGDDKTFSGLLSP